MKKALCIINPAAGKGGAERTRRIVADCLRAEYDVSFCVTQGRGDAERMAGEVGDADALICCGGDGTLSEAVNGLRRRGKSVPILYVPRGTANDLAKTLRVPGNVKKCLALASGGRVAALDLGVFNGDSRFTYMAGFGAFTEVSYRTPQRLKNRLGYLAYLISSIKSFVRARPVRARVAADGWEARGEYIFGSVSNSLSIGGAIRLHREGVALDDGALELLLVEKPKNRLDFLRVIAHCVLLRRFDAPGVLLRRVFGLTAEFEEQTDWTVDGEYAGAHKSVSIGVEKEAFRVFAPEAARGA